MSGVRPDSSAVMAKAALKNCNVRQQRFESDPGGSLVGRVDGFEINL